ncbi:tRNA (guanine(37)-N1)-methyltransferase-like [Varroa destructor]|uniref:tRNA (guanine(37)-N1)-methyltransferase n=1 Tax=Varroa destructor TaxID=109461 RepID=A0A7M7M9J5_VARDE|nr:tRNA (guanine(37)-N1)-methyltransferase-like [Varroa destructor]
MFRACRSLPPSKMYKKISPPDAVIGMTELDRDKFNAKFSVPCTTVTDPSSFNDILEKMKQLFLKVANFKPVQELPDGGRRIIFDSEKLNDHIIRQYEIQPTEIDLGYDNFPADVILKKVLSKATGGTGGAGFSIVGHILHLNLREHLLPYKKVIGQVLLDKTKNIQIVVNKTAEIQNEFRNFNFEILAGEGSTIARVKENGCVYEFDFSKVYWNPRLSTEHDRITKLLSRNSILFDVFAGVGPFTMPAAKKGCTIYANDLNPDSYEYLVKNLKRNKIEHRVEAFKLDGREFLRQVLVSKAALYLGQDIHITMNLPAVALEFLDVFPTLKLPAGCVLKIHCYCFVRSDCKRTATTWSLVRKHLGVKLGVALPFQLDEDKAHFVRSVAPGKDMVRASFVLKYITKKSATTTGANIGASSTECPADHGGSASGSHGITAGNAVSTETSSTDETGPSEKKKMKTSDDVK